MRILHFAPDDKFLPFVQRSFEEVFPGASEYRVLGDANKPLQFLMSGSNVRVVETSYWSSHDVRLDMENCDCLLVHFMTADFSKALRQVPNDVLVGWIGWGGDYYHLFEPFLGNLHLPETSALMKRLSAGVNQKSGRIWRFLIRSSKEPALLVNKARSLLNTQQVRDLNIDAIVPRLDFVWVNPEEVGMFERALPKFRKRYHRICYYSSEDIFRAGARRMHGPDILVGNSATPSNNHIELFETLNGLDIDGRRLVVPLNYGIPAYGEKIAQIGRAKFGSCFFALRDFMPLDEYSELLGGCGTIMMNHVRQQAGTTIATGLYKGAKIYLRNENIVGPFYRKMGMRLWSIQDDLNAESDIFGPLSEDETLRNQKILDEYWGHQAALNAIRELEVMVENKRSGHAD